MKGPPVLRVSTSPAALTAAFEVENSNAYYYVRRKLGNRHFLPTRVLKFPAFTATSTILAMERVDYSNTIATGEFKFFSR